MLKFIKRLFKILFLLGIIAALVIAGAVIYKIYPMYEEYSQEAKKAIEDSNTNTFKRNLTSYFYDHEGNLLTELSGNGSKIYLTFEEIPENVINAFIAVEDRTFWTHKGIDPKAIVRVSLEFVTSKGETVHGASTITQQLVRNVFISKEVTIERKIKEICYALEVEKKYSKEEIMEFYVNNIYFANNCYGIEAAAQFYFDKPAKELSLNETAYLCAIPNSPAYYDPLKNSSNALPRRDKVLKDMQECEFITETQRIQALREDLVLNEKKPVEIKDYETTYAIDCAIRYLMKLDGFLFRYSFATMEDYNFYMETYNQAYERIRAELYIGGYVVTTTLNKEKQTLLQESVDNALAFDEELAENGQYAFQGAATVINNETGKVEAIVGGRTQNSSTYTLNRAYQSYRQPGSSIKPLIVYLPALERGYTDRSTVTEINVEKAKEEPEKVLEMYGTKMTLRSAVENSKNGAAWRLFCEITPEAGLNYLQEMSFARIVPDDFYPAASLGGFTYGVTTVEMANAYSCMVNHGRFQQTDCIVSILDKYGEELYEPYETRQVYVSEQTELMIDILKGVITKGTARKMGWKSTVEAAGKTGTTNNSKDGWFVGVTPDYSMAVWVGYDMPRELSNLYGGSYPAQIWKDTMEMLVQDTEHEHFETTTEIVNGDEKYYPGRDGSEVLSPGYTVQNYRDDHALADQIDALILKIAQESDPGQREAYYEQAKALAEQIYGQTLKGAYRNKLAELNGQLQQ
ncbi:transglycosylase domain-containing protein [Candidatus Merdisoma sp. JLR.KK006]|uniref:transglycosylase domain-containing protein n=1 Tax=Candidatus Merdisoma sp. JLR.KK006 TaxID=3112626 RepID=UPI002FF04129